ncbi:hypothetical protein [Streptomyces syringium]|uniref:hypothetical protein n=1 Tax=Streptomyces syringium TaxID=76729 RepID=UPI003454752B
MAVGVLGDGLGWWDGRSYLTNLFSSLTGLLFGVPFALLVLSRFAQAQADVVERREVRRLIERVTRDFDSALDEVFEGSRLRSQEVAVKDIVREWRAALPGAEQLRGAIGQWATEAHEAGLQPWNPGPQFRASASAQAALEAAVAAVNRARSLRPYARLCPAEWPEWNWKRKLLQGRWMELNREVRQRVKENGLDWVSTETMAVLDDGIRDHGLWRHCWKPEEVEPTYSTLIRVAVLEADEEIRSAEMVWELLTVSEQIRRVTGTD